jgi:hypothetical protein
VQAEGDYPICTNTVGRNIRYCGDNAFNSDEMSFVFPWPQPCTMSNVMNNDLVRSDFVYDQVVAGRKSSELGIACCCTQMRLLGDQRCCLFDTCDELGRCPRLVFRNVCKNLVKVGERTAFEPQLHALR